MTRAGTMKRTEMAGIFDWLKKKAVAPPPSGGIIYVGPGGEARRELIRKEEPGLPAAPKPTVEEKLLSIFQVFEPGQSKLPALAEKMDILPGFIKASPPKDLSASEESAQLELYSELFEEAKEEEASLFEALPEGRPEEIRPAAPIMRPAREIQTGKAAHEDWPRGEPPLYWITDWRVPSAFEVAHWIKTNPERWDLLGLFEFTLENTDYPGWRRLVEDSAHTGEPAELEIDMVAHWGSAYEELANFLEIPQRVVDVYFGDIRDEEMAHERAWLFQDEVIEPYVQNISRALDALRPRQLRGWFEISPADDYSWWLKYLETRFR